MTHRIDWPAATLLIVLIACATGASIAITAIQLKHRRLMAGQPGLIATILGR